MSWGTRSLLLIFHVFFFFSIHHCAHDCATVFSSDDNLEVEIERQKKWKIGKLSSLDLPWRSSAICFRFQLVFLMRTFHDFEKSNYRIAKLLFYYSSALELSLICNQNSYEILTLNSCETLIHFWYFYDISSLLFFFIIWDHLHISFWVHLAVFFISSNRLHFWYSNVARASHFNGGKEENEN